ncbi:MAG TPA: UDP-N-acetylmuramate dehydrogenase [Candidatus Saccharimonadales bacterium]|nr:UDP-N-acetylmuramate dehydrogenase [Candidatus Saccharimonadales bacterium]
MLLQENVPLSAYSTMRLGGPARYLAEIQNRNEIKEAVDWATQQNLPVVMVGGGSNIFWNDSGYNGLVLINRIMGFEIFKEDDLNAFVTVGAGEDWDSVVKRVVEAGYGGIQELSLIPGTAGATPIQNVGAYGREMSEVLVTIEAFDRQTDQLVNLRASECEFSYRSSRFKTTDKGRFFISAITFLATKTPPLPPFYGAVETYFKEHHITEFTPSTIRKAVIAIRSAKLPDPVKVANNGSFFHNPIIAADLFRQLVDDYPNMVYWHQDDGTVKLSAAWLVDHAGFRNFHDEALGFGTWVNQSLVIVNENSTKTADLLAFKQQIVDTVKDKFGVTLNQEPELIES